LRNTLTPSCCRSDEGAAPNGVSASYRPNMTACSRVRQAGTALHCGTRGHPAAASLMSVLLQMVCRHPANISYRKHMFIPCLHHPGLTAAFVQLPQRVQCTTCARAVDMIPRPATFTVSPFQG
jgi:hypothetical protein